MFNFFLGVLFILGLILSGAEFDKLPILNIIGLLLFVGSGLIAIRKFRR